MKRVVTIQDLSCIGRCSLGVAMAVLPAMGIETAALPTALLSAHTQFEGFTFLDLTDEAEKIMAHWQKLGIRFDTIYIGYLGSVRLVRMASRFIHIFRTVPKQQDSRDFPVRFYQENIFFFRRIFFLR